MLTRQHYKAIAEIIKSKHPGYAQHDYYKGERNALVRVGRSLADYFEQDNPRFDRDKFLAACGL